MALPLPPGSVIGILGGGQLGRMLAIAAYALGYKVHGYCPDADTPLSQVTDRYTAAGYEDEAALVAFAAKVDIVTFEFENVPAQTVEVLKRQVPVRPNGRSLAIIQDRFEEKSFLANEGIAVAPFAAISGVEALREALKALGHPAILKTRRFGYDGKGQVKISEKTEPEAAFAAIGGQAAILEGFIPFERELSILAARGVDGSIATYPLTENRHVDHILAVSVAPAAVPQGVAEEAEAIARRVVQALDYVGVIGIEFFLKEGRLIVNELAPRVHNSGHWTIEGAVTSQFEQHIRAICGLPLGDARALFRAEMTNLVGDEVDAWPAILAEGNAHLHLYGKDETRKGRKMGHVTRLFPLQDSSRG